MLYLLKSRKPRYKAFLASNSLCPTVAACPAVKRLIVFKEPDMDVFVYGKRQTLPEGFEEFVTVSDTAVVSIDLHQGHLADTEDCPCPAPRAREVVDGVNRFHVAARALHVPIIHVKSVLRRDGSDDINGLKSAWRFVFPLYVGPIPNSDQHALQGSRWTQFVTEIAQSDHVVETKKRLSAFYPTDLDFLLRNMDVKRIVLNGCMTDCCILNAAFDASNLGYRVTVAQDLVRGTNAEMEAAALKMISLHIGLVAESSDLIEEWRRQIERGQAPLAQMQEKVASV
jgi:biuret amidohydrolase